LLIADGVDLGAAPLPELDADEPEPPLVPEAGRDVDGALAEPASKENSSDGAGGAARVG
jgi:hypothetical protein